MRRVFVLMGLVGLLVWGLAPGAPASATQMCSTTCSGLTLKCCVSSGTCSSSAGSINCNGTVYTCDALNAYQACRLGCADLYIDCRHSCEDSACLSACSYTHSACLQSCGSAPQSNFGC